MARFEPPAGVRRVIEESWHRSAGFDLDPDAPPDTVGVADDALRAYRDAHPLALALPTINQLLVRHTVDSGLIVAIGDQAGRLLWVDGDRDLRRRAEAMAFVEGADWSERAVGTSAPGTALVLGRSVQVRGAEHFNRIVHPWSCSAVPVRDRTTGSLIGVIDITGGDDAVAPATLPLLEATVAAVEAELQLRDESHRAQRRRADRRRATPLRAVTPLAAVGAPQPSGALPSEQRTAAGPAQSDDLTTPLLSVLGRTEGLLQVDGRDLELSPRHAEILTLLAWHRSGMTAHALADAVYEREDAVMTLRAEMVRLRKALERVAPRIAPTSRPYRLPAPLELDAHRVLAFLDRGAHRVALSCYAGAVLPGSTAPGIALIRDQVRRRLRESLLADAGVDTLLEFARTEEAVHDVELWRACLRLLPSRSPRRAGVVAHLEWIDAELA